MGDKVQKHGSGSDHNTVSAKDAVLRQESELPMEDSITPTGKRLFLLFPVTETSMHMQSKQLYFFLLSFLTHFCVFANVSNGSELFAL